MTAVCSVFSKRNPFSQIPKTISVENAQEADPKSQEEDSIKDQMSTLSMIDQSISPSPKTNNLCSTTNPLVPKTSQSSNKNPTPSTSITPTNHIWITIPKKYNKMPNIKIYLLHFKITQQKAMHPIITEALATVASKIIQ